MPDTTQPGMTELCLNVPQVDGKSLQESLMKAVGRFVVCKFLVGAKDITTLSGVLRNVGNSYFVLLDPCTEAETTCDIHALKFITSYPEGVPETPMYCNHRLYEIY